MRRFWVAPCLAAVAVLPFLGCGSKQKTSSAWAGHTTGPKVAVSFAPLYCLTVNVVGDKGTVKSVLSTRGPHDAEVGSEERALLESADLVFLNGLGLDESISDGTKKTVLLTDKFKDEWLRHPDEDGGKHEHKPGDKHAHGKHDPHVWLSPTLAVDLVKRIQVELRSKHPEYAADYDRNAAAYIKKLEQLQKDGRALLKGKSERTFATLHESLGYFADEFDLKIAGFLHKEPGTEAGADDIKGLVQKCKAGQARVVAVEPQYSAAGAKTLVESMKQAGIADPVIIELDPIETATAAELTADLYETKMRANLEALSKALK